MTRRPILVAGLVLGAFAVVGVGLVALTHELTVERIAANQRLALLATLQRLVPPERADNDILGDQIRVQDRDLLGSDTNTVYRARHGSDPVALILDPVVPNGYAGPMRLLVSVLPDGRLQGVRVVSHHETPGLGDLIEEQRSDWIHGFDGKSLTDPPLDKWGVKRDGGVFDQFTGATITPRSLVRAVMNCLLFVQRRGEALYQTPPETPPETPAVAPKEQSP